MKMKGVVAVRFGFLSLAILVTAIAYAHVQILPKESASGDNETYTMLVPDEKNIATVRIEAEFPTAVVVSEIEPKDGWKIDSRKDASGKIIGAVWSGSSIAPKQSADFSFRAKNPSESAKLTWRVVQFYEDGSKSEWTGEEGSRSPAPVTQVVKK
jgi:uncharacterized protein YcnI